MTTYPTSYKRLVLSSKYTTYRFPWDYFAESDPHGPFTVVL